MNTAIEVIGFCVGVGLTAAAIVWAIWKASHERPHP
jgi:hypothetical protein